MLVRTIVKGNGYFNPEIKVSKLDVRGRPLFAISVTDIEIFGAPGTKIIEMFGYPLKYLFPLLGFILKAFCTVYKGSKILAEKNQSPPGPSHH